MYDTGNTTISGNLDVGTNYVSNAQPNIKVHAGNWNNYTGYATISMFRPWSVLYDITTSLSYAFAEFKVKGDLFMTLNGADNKVQTNKDLDVGVGASTSKIKVNSSMSGYTGYTEIHCPSAWGSIFNLQTTYPNGGWMYFQINGVNFIQLSGGDQKINMYKPLTQSSDDRLKENEELIENACETLFKLRPQLYDKKPSIDNEDETTWYKESGLIAQEVYYDAPELRHLVHRASNKVDEEGNEIPLPEIPTSINPQEDPDYSSWGEEAASLNYIGLIAYLVRANNELHDRVKALEILISF